MLPVRLILFIFLIGIVFSGVTLLIARFDKNKALPKYLPSAVLLTAGVFYIIKAKWFSEGMQDLGNILTAMLSFGGCIISLGTALFIDVFRKLKGV